MHPVHPAMMAAIAADHIRDMREDAARDKRAKVSRRARRHRTASHHQAGCELIEQHA